MSNIGRRKNLNGIRIIARALLSLYLVLSVPFRWAFIPNFSLRNVEYVGFVLVDLLATIYFIWENAISLKTSFHQVLPLNDLENPPSGSLVSCHSIATHDSQQENVRSPFIQILSRVKISSLLSILASIPLEYFSFMLVFDVHLNYLMFNRLIRIGFLPSYANDISGFLEEKGLMKNLSLHRAWKLFCAMALAGHWCGCVFFFIAKKEALNGNPFTWPQSIGLFEVNLGRVGQEAIYLHMNESEVRMYIQSLYWAYITMVSFSNYFSSLLLSFRN